MVEYTLNGCAPEFALWSFVDLGYLTYYVAYLLATGAHRGRRGRDVRRRPPMGDYTCSRSPPTRPARTSRALRVLMGPFTVYNTENVEAAAG